MHCCEVSQFPYFKCPWKRYNCWIFCLFFNFKRGTSYKVKGFIMVELKSRTSYKQHMNLKTCATSQFTLVSSAAGLANKWTSPRLVEEKDRLYYHYVRKVHKSVNSNVKWRIHICTELRSQIGGRHAMH